VREQQRLSETWVRPGQLGDEESEKILGGPLTKEQKLIDLLRRPQVTYESIMQLSCANAVEIAPSVAEQVEVQAKYAGYIERQREEIARHRRHEETTLPDDFPYDQVRGLSIEAQQKLMTQRPATVGQAGRVPGVTPAAISLLLVHLKKRSAHTKQRTAG